MELHPLPRLFIKIKTFFKNALERGELVAGGVGSNHTQKPAGLGNGRGAASAPP
jgi:hypothetical protein